MKFTNLRITQKEYKSTSKNDDVVIFIADKIITMDEDFKQAKAVAVQSGKILALGDLEDIKSMLRFRGLEFKINDSFKDKVILPGFIEAHMHVQYAGVNYNHVYVGYFDCHNPSGGINKGCKSVEEIIYKLKGAYEANKSKYNDSNWLNAYGVDPLVLGGAKIDSKLLDSISKDIPICLNHQSGHLMSINSKAIALSGIEEVKNSHVGRYPDGSCDGNIAEVANMSYVLKAGGMKISGDAEEIACQATIDASNIARINGCTTITDKAFGLPLVPKTIEGYKKAYASYNLPCRIVAEPFIDVLDSVFGGWDGLEKLRGELENDMFIIGNAKTLQDGSIQGYTANLLSDTYYNGKPNSKLIYDKQKLISLIKDCEAHGYSLSIHTNGNGATQSVIEAIEEIHKDSPNTLFRHSLEHNQMVSQNQLFRMKKQNLCSNLFINHIYFWGDVHATYTLGPVEVKRMDPLASVQRHGIRFSFHSDYPVTEVNPLFSAYVACNRKAGISGKVYGEDEVLSVESALRAITIDAAYLLGLEDSIGSIEIGKWADFVVLEEEPREEIKERLKDIGVVATILGGEVS